MTFIILLIPIILAVMLLIFFPKKTTWWEYCLLIIPSILMFFIIKYAIISYEESDTEYLGNYITKVTYYQPWNEYIHRTCHHIHKCGKATISIPYDCSYVDEHPEQYTYTLNNGNEVYTTKEDFIGIKRFWKTKPKFRELNRHYYRKDGDAYDTQWDGNKMYCGTRTFAESYTNKINASHSIFKLKDISYSEAKAYKLFNYPTLETDYAQQAQVLGLNKKDARGCQMIKYINGRYGKEYQFRTYILIFYNRPQTIAEKQRSYWEGGNKNEFIVCLSIDSLTNKVEWCEPFSWQDNPLLEVKTRQYFLSNPNFNLYLYGCWLEENIKGNWHRKQFDKFDYINVDLSETQYKWLIIFIAFYNISMSIYVVMNKYVNEDVKKIKKDENKMIFY